MFRRDLIDLLLDTPRSIRQIARELRTSPNTVKDDLEHLFKSLRHTEYVAVVAPAQCRKCGFEFAGDKLAKPSKCPKCHSTWLTEPRICIQRKDSASADLGG
jgi:hypothetical protein